MSLTVFPGKHECENEYKHERENEKNKSRGIRPPHNRKALV